MWQMIGVLAELERSLINERTRAGAKAAKGRDIKFGARLPLSAPSTRKHTIRKNAHRLGREGLPPSRSWPDPSFWYATAADWLRTQIRRPARSQPLTDRARSGGRRASPERRDQGSTH
jgi:hypothetical protein